MGRKQTLIIYPHLNDHGGDLSKDWYVEFKYRIPEKKKIVCERIYKGLQVGTVNERLERANQIIDEKTIWLNSGGHLLGMNKTRVYVDELEYAHATRLYGNIKKELPTIRQNISEYLIHIKRLKSVVTYSNIQTKLRTFVAYLVKKQLDVDISNIDRKNIIDFLIYLANDMKLSRATIKDYKQVVYNYFDFEIELERLTINPVNRIPKLGQIVDNAAVPFTNNEKKDLKNLISAHDLQLWLACQIQYYCAIRPGYELRCMKIGWIDFDKKQFRIPNEFAKNNETEIVEIPDVLFDQLVSIYSLDSYSKDLYVFGSNGTPGINFLGKNTLRNRFNRFRDQLKIPTSKVFYSWKHTGAIDLIQNGLQPYNLQEHLRHKNFDTTERYLKKRIKSKDKKINRFTTEL